MINMQFHNFEEAGKRVLKFLHEHFGFGLWMITRVENDKWIILQSENEKYEIKQGQVFRWVDSYCYHMVQGKTPKIAPCSKKIEVYAQAAINQHLNIESYIGEPLMNEDGSVFGTICGIDTEIKSEEILKDSPIMELLGSLLSTILQSELRENQQRRLRERFEVEALTDGLTGLYNRRAWGRLLNQEEERCQRYGLPSTIFSLDLNDLKQVNDQFGHAQGDRLIQNAANLLTRSMRSNDVIARIGGDEFVILCPEMTMLDAEGLFDRLLSIFAEVNLQVAIGYSCRQLNTTLQDVFIQADQNMYRHKKHNKPLNR